MHEVMWWENALNKYAHFCTTVYLAARKGNSQNRGYHYTNNEARLVKIKATDKRENPVGIIIIVINYNLFLI